MHGEGEEVKMKRGEGTPRLRKKLRVLRAASDTFFIVYGRLYNRSNTRL